MLSARQPLMEASDNHATASPAPEDGSRRSRSGRVVRAPSKFTPEAAPAAGKRKRPEDHDDDDDDDDADDDDNQGHGNGENLENEPPASDSELSDPDDDIDDPDDQDHAATAGHARPKKRRPASSNKVKKPAAKKPKINGSTPAYAADLPSRPKKAARVAIVDNDGEGLYADVFGSGARADDVAGRWYTSYNEDKAAAVKDLVNCVLQAAGCQHQISEDDVNDPDNCENRLAELQSLYEDQQLAEYPLIAKSRTTRSFRTLLVEFFGSLITVLHETQALYEDEALMENIARWVATMSSSTLRPFRHTATTVSLAMHYALVNVTKKVDERIIKITQQLESEKGRRKDKASRDKIASLQASLDEANQHREVCGTQMTDLFETIFVHRYRDIDVRIRTECVEALGTWIYLLPTVYMEPEYLRYLGWMLTDTNPGTRAEVLRQLARIFKRDAEKLGHFIERFRDRLVEMCTRDTDVAVRVAAISVIDCLRVQEMLQPDDIDQIGKLIIDADVRIRKAVSDFFVLGIEDSVELKIQEIGGSEALEEVFEQDQDAYDSPRKDWIKIKCLAEMLAGYAADEEPAPPRTEAVEIATDVIEPAFTETRVTLASQALFEKLPEVSNWEIIAGYLLFDHSVSQASKSRSKSKPTEATFRAAVAPEGEEEAILLEVLAAAVQLNLAQNVEHDRHRKRPARTADGEVPEGTAVHLADAIPRLLNKYGAEASTARIVLGLHHHLDLEVFLQLRQDTTTYARLLDEICAQFLRHADSAVIFQATRALLVAQRHEELKELAERKIEDLWQNIVASLRRFDRSTELSVRGNLDENVLLQLITVVMKISKLASICHCVHVLEAEGESDESKSPAINILANMVYRGRLGEVNDDIDNIEDELTVYTIKACNFYFVWKTHDIRTAIQNNSDIPDPEISKLSYLRQAYDTNLVHTFSSRGGYDDLRLFATGNLCDLQLLCASIGTAVATCGDLDRYTGLKVLVRETDPGQVSEIIAIYDTAERLYGQRARRQLGDAAADDDPLDEDVLSDDEAEADKGRTDEGRRVAELRAEKNLCDIAAKLVMIVRARMIDQSGPRAGRLRRRLLRNQHRLGPNFKAVVAFLDESKDPETVGAGAGDRKKSRSAAAKGKLPATATAAAAAAATADSAGGRKQHLSDEMVTADDIEDDEPEPEEGTVEDLRRRELLDDPIEDEPEEEDEDEGGGGGGNDGMDEDSVIGD
ncbi:hypothetical protein RB596_002377 [Gaeumannomyces avenae]